MALDQSALLEVLDALKAADVADRVRQAAETDLPGVDRGRADRGDRRRACTSAPTPAPSSATVTAPDAVDHGRGSGAADPEAAHRVVLPVAAGAAPPGRPGVVRGGHGGLPARRLDPQGRRPGQGARRRHRHLQVRGVADLRRPRHRRSARSATGRWPTSSSRTCSWTPPTARPGSTTGSCPRPSWPERTAQSRPFAPVTRHHRAALRGHGAGRQVLSLAERRLPRSGRRGRRPV